MILTLFSIMGFIKLVDSINERLIQRTVYCSHLYSFILEPERVKNPIFKIRYFRTFWKLFKMILYFIKNVFLFQKLPLRDYQNPHKESHITTGYCRRSVLFSIIDRNNWKSCSQYIIFLISQNSFRNVKNKNFALLLETSSLLQKPPVLIYPHKQFFEKNGMAKTTNETVIMIRMITIRY